MDFFTNPCEAMNLVEEQYLDRVIVCAYTLLSTILLLGMNMEHSSLPPQLLLPGLPQVQGLQPSPCRPATVNQLQANISEVAQIDPDMMKRTMLDMRERAVKCRAAGGRHLEKQSSYQLYPC